MRSAVNRSFSNELNAPNAIPFTDKAVSTGQICRSMQQRSAQRRFAEAILKPDGDLDPRRGAATAVLGDSTTITGVPRNEDNFSLHLRHLMELSISSTNGSSVDHLSGNYRYADRLCVFAYRH